MNKELVCGVGISDDGKYTKYITSEHRNTREYDMWQKMLARCYSSYTQKREPTYKGCTVANELLSFQNFAEFYNQNKWRDDEVLIPDKDILTHGKAKIYSKDTICFVDGFINKIFTKRQRFRGDLPIGVSVRNYPTGLVKYVAVCNEYGKCRYLGTYDTPQKAFNAYKIEKERYIKQVAEEYKEKFPLFPMKLYNAMKEYEVSYND